MGMLKRGARAVSLCAAGLLVMAGSAGAQVSSTNPAGLIVFPRVVIDRSVDTQIQISNTSGEPVHVRCYLVNANSHCSNQPDLVCRSEDDCCPSPGCGAFCLPGWTETDFRFTLTKYQPIVWRVGDGLPSFPLDGISRVTQDGQFNVDSNIPPAPEIPFLGELKCFQVDGNDNPVALNDLKGEATIVFASEDVDAEIYNAVGIPATLANDGNDVLCLGGTEPTEECPIAEYEGCPNVLILNHLFDNPFPPLGESWRTRLTVAPCSEDFLNQATVKTTLQFLVFNEYEQRFSTSRRFDCLFESYLSDIDTRPGPDDDLFSIFGAAVQGTYAGQSRIRAVQTDQTNVGHGVVAIAEEGHQLGELYLAAFQVHHAGIRTQGDIIRAPRE